MFLNKIVEYKSSSKTKYRIVSDGIIWHLQYRQETKLFSVFKMHTWKHVWRPYVDANGGRLMDVCGYESYICSYNTILTEFVKRWQDINEYFLWASDEQKKLEIIRKQTLQLQKNMGAYRRIAACF